MTSQRKYWIVRALSVMTQWTNLDHKRFLLHWFNFCVFFWFLLFFLFFILLLYSFLFYFILFSFLCCICVIYSLLLCKYKNLYSLDCFFVGSKFKQFSFSQLSTNYFILHFSDFHIFVNWFFSESIFTYVILSIMFINYFNKLSLLIIFEENITLIIITSWFH